MDEFTLQCLYQNKADFNAGRISVDTYNKTLLSLIKYQSSGYINNNEYIVYPKAIEDNTSEENEKEEDARV
jgi:hypothetical protein